MQPPADKWDEWFAAYQHFILHYADIAQAEGVELLCIGCEMDKVTFTTSSGITADATARWMNLINTIKGRYTGKLTYSPGAAGDGSGPAKIGFWGALDYIGFENYFSLTGLDDPTVAELLAALDNVLNTVIKPVSDAYGGKPVLMTEINCRSFNGVNKGDPIREPPAGAVVDLQEQADIYEAFFQAMENKSWIQGIFWWAWYLTDTAPIDAEYKLSDMGDTFVRKTAGQVMRKWYGKIID